jgi:phosphotransferase system enzyme I (PtsP)
MGIGYRSLSVSAAAVGPVKSLILETDAAKLRALVNPLVDRGEADIRGAIRSFAEQNGLTV